MSKTMNVTDDYIFEPKRYSEYTIYEIIFVSPKLPYTIWKLSKKWHSECIQFTFTVYFQVVIQQHTYTCTQ